MWFVSINRKVVYKKVNIISLGAGVQSSTMALMAKCGELTPMPDCAIFADTQAEPKPVYDWLDWLEKQLPYPVHRVTAGNLQSASLKVITGKSGRKYTKHRIPAFTLGDKKGMFQRQCTLDFKIVPIKRKVRELYKGKVTMWIGISLDEVIRMKPSRVKYIENIWPLIDKRMSRQSCLNWMKKNDYPLPKRSACYFCPFHNDREWKNLSKEDFARAVSYEKELQTAVAQVQNKETNIAVPFLHPQRIPLDKVKFSTDEADLFNNECEGHCGI